MLESVKKRLEIRNKEYTDVVEIYRKKTMEFARMFNENITSNRKIHRHAREKIKKLKRKTKYDFKKADGADIKNPVPGETGEDFEHMKEENNDLKNEKSTLKSSKVGFFQKIFQSFKIKNDPSEIESQKQPERSSDIDYSGMSTFSHLNSILHIPRVGKSASTVFYFEKSI